MAALICLSARPPTIPPRRANPTAMPVTTRRVGGSSMIVAATATPRASTSNSAPVQRPGPLGIIRAPFGSIENSSAFQNQRHTATRLRPESSRDCRGIRPPVGPQAIGQWHKPPAWVVSATLFGMEDVLNSALLKLRPYRRMRLLVFVFARLHTRRPT